MERDRALEVIEREASRILDLADDPGVPGDSPVPSCPGWALDDLLNHLGRVYAMVVTVLADTAGGGRPDRDLIPRRGEDQAPDEWLRQRLQLLLAALAELPPGARRWSFVGGAGSPVDFWWRRQVHETLVHRVDAELAGGATLLGVEPEIAADGVEELLAISGHREVPWDELPLGHGMTVHLHAADLPGAEWTVETSSRTYAVAHLKADVALQGPAWSLFRWLWRRGSVDAPPPLALAELEAFGDVPAAESWRPSI